MAKTSTSFKNGWQGGPGRPKSQQNKDLEFLRKIMKDMRVARISLEDLQNAQQAAARLASTDFNYYKFIVDREDDFADDSLPVVTSLRDIPKAKNQAMKMLSKSEITFTKHKKIMEALKSSRDIDVEDSIDAAERIKKRTES